MLIDDDGGKFNGRFDGVIVDDNGGKFNGVLIDDNGGKFGERRYYGGVDRVQLGSVDRVQLGGFHGHNKYTDDGDAYHFGDYGALQDDDGADSYAGYSTVHLAYVPAGMGDFLSTITSDIGSVVNTVGSKVSQAANFVGQQVGIVKKAGNSVSSAGQGLASSGLNINLPAAAQTDPADQSGVPGGSGSTGVVGTLESYKWYIAGGVAALVVGALILKKSKKR